MCITNMKRAPPIIEYNESSGCFIDTTLVLLADISRRLPAGGGNVEIVKTQSSECDKVRKNG